MSRVHFILPALVLALGSSAPAQSVGTPVNSPTSRASGAPLLLTGTTALVDVAQDPTGVSQEQSPREKAEQAVAELTKDPGLGAEQTQLAVHGLVAILLPLQEYAQAQELLERALEDGRKTLGLDHAAVLETMFELVVALYYGGKFREAITLADELVLASEEARGPLDSMTLRARQTVADMLEPLGEFERAREMYLKLAPQLEEAQGPQSIALAGLLHNHAFMEARLGAYGPARALYERALEIRLKAFGEDHPETIATLSTLGVLLRKQEDLSAARDILERVTEIVQRNYPPGHPQVARAMAALAWVRIDEGKWEEAVEMLEQAVAIHEATVGKESLQVARTLTQLAGALKGQGGESLERARDLLERALAIRVARLGREDLSTAHTLGMLADVLNERYEIDAALAACSESLNVFESKLGPDAPQTLHVRHLKGNILLRGWGPEAAIPSFQETLKRRAADGSAVGSSSRAVTQSMLGVSLLFVGRHEEALHLSIESFREAWTYIVGQSAGMTEEELFTFLSIQRGILQVLLGMPDHQESPEATQLAYEAQLAWKGMVARLVHTTRARVHAAPNPERTAALDELASVHGDLSNLFLGQDDDEKRTSMRIELEARRQALLRSLEASSGPGLRWIEWTELRDALPARTAALDLLTTDPYQRAQPEEGGGDQGGINYGEPHMLAWVVTGESEAPIRIDLGPAKTIEAAVREALDGLRPAASGRGITRTDDREANKSQDSLQRLSELLWTPLAPHFKGIERIVVSPDGMLCGLPFEVLVDSEDKHLIERFAFVYSHDLAGQLNAPRSKVAPSAAPSLLIAGGVNFNSRESDEPQVEGAEGAESALRGKAGSSWALLPGTEREAKAIAGLHRECFGEDAARSELGGTSATEEAIGAALPHYTVVHLATHGFFLGASFEERLAQSGKAGIDNLLPGLRNGLVFAGANEPPQAGRADGFLTAEEIGWLDLTNVDLVVLSACDTAQGVTQSGEGLIGLRRAFRGAAARSVISSLWPVDDQATTELMGGFYARLWRDKISAVDALRSAQLEILTHNRKEHSDSRPSTWGAFVLAGDWR